MIHIRVDDEELNSKRRFACGIGPNLPEGDKYFFQGEALAYSKADCPGCNPGGPVQPGIPLSQLTGQQYVRICNSWGYQ